LTPEDAKTHESTSRIGREGVVLAALTNGTGTAPMTAKSVNYETGCRHDDFLAQIKFAINDHHFKAERWQEIVGRCLRA
jgi:hypothetical protein